MKKIILCALALIACTASFNTALAHGHRHLVRFSTDQPGLDEEDGTLFVALPIINEGTAVASNVQVRSIRLASGTRITPAAFPVTLGDIAASQRAILDASFTSSGLVPDKRYLLKVKGTYVLKGRAFRFVVHRRISLPPPETGEREVSTATAEPNTVSGPFPAEDFAIAEEEGEAAPPVPIGPFRGLVPASPSAELLEPIVVDEGDLETFRASLQQAANPVVFVRRTPFGPVLSPAIIAADPSVASSGNIVLASGNTFGFLSPDGGRTFMTLNPMMIFPNRDPMTGRLFDGGLCCDQHIHYVPRINRFVWLMRFEPLRGALGELLSSNRIRLAMASPQDILTNVHRAWTFWDLTAALFGFGTSVLSYPNVSVGDNFLYLSINVSRRREGLMVVRIPLHELANRQTIHAEHTDPEKIAFLGHAIQNPGNEVFWAGHRSNSKLQIFSLREDSTRYSWRSIKIKNWPRERLFSLAPLPDQTDWLTYLGENTPQYAVIGGTRRVRPGISDELFFAWTASRGGDFPHAHIQVVRLDRSNFSVLDQFPIQFREQNLAAAYPALITNANNEVAVSLMVGGPALFPTHAVGMLEDHQVFGSSTSDGALPRNGDFVTVRQHFPNSKLFSAAGHGVRLVDPTNPSKSCKITPTSLQGCRYDPHYVLFGRASDIASGVDLVPVLASSNSCTIQGIVENRGDTDARASLTVVNLIVEPPIVPGVGFQIETPPIAASGAVNLPQINLLTGPARRVCFRVGGCEYTITVDSVNVIEESNERNNFTRGRCVGLIE